MGFQLFHKLTNFLMPLPETEKPLTETPQDSKVALLKHSRDSKDRHDSEQISSIRPYLKVHSQPPSVPLKILVEEPSCFDDVQKYADYLRSDSIVLINYQQVPPEIQEKICDFLNGVCYILEGSVQRVSKNVILYAYSAVEIDKKFFSYSVPAYERIKTNE